MMKWFESIFERGSQSQWAARRRQSDHFFGQNFQSRGRDCFEKARAAQQKAFFGKRFEQRRNK